MQSRKDEILAKKAKLAELKKQKELRQKEFSAGRHSFGTPSDSSPSGRKQDSRQELDSLIDSLVGDERRSSPAPGTPPSARRSRPSSYASPARQDGQEGKDADGEPTYDQVPSSREPQQLSFMPMKTLYEIKSDPPKREIITYSKGVQTTDHSLPTRSPHASDSESDERPSSSARHSPRRRSTRKDKEREEELRQNIRREIEQELQSLRDPEAGPDGVAAGTVDGVARRENFPARALSNEEVDAVTSSNDFLDFVERSSKVIERALDEEYDVLADYRHGNVSVDDEEDDEIHGRGRKGRRIKEVMQFYDERWSRKRMVSDIGFSPKFPELILTSHTKNPSAPYDPSGLLQIWNTHMHSRPEYTFHATSDILTAKFSPFHPNLILGGSYSGQVLLWDTRSRSHDPVQRTPLTGSGHTHPVYSINVVGTQNAHHVVSTSTDGVLCAWSVDMLAHPQEHLELLSPPTLAQSSTNTTNPLPTRPTDDLAPTTTAFPASDPTYALLGTESGLLHIAHRYSRAGARAGTDARVLYAGHAAPVMSLDFHRPAGPVDLSDLVLSASLDWSVKLWRVRTPAATNISAATPGSGPGAPTATAGAQSQTQGKLDVHAPVLDIPREDAVYDAKWSPVKPGVFACADGSGALEIWDLTVDAEVPAVRTLPERYQADVDPSLPSAGGVSGARSGVYGQAGGRSLNKVAWEPHEGRKVAAGGLDGVMTLWEVGAGLGGAESARGEEWGRMRRLVARAEAGGE